MRRELPHNICVSLGIKICVNTVIAIKKHRQVGMIKDFSKPSNKAIANAVKVACSFGHYSVGPEHLLVALCELEGCDAHKIIRKHSSRGFDMRALAAQKLGSGEPSKLHESDISSELAGIISFSGVCAERLGDGCIGTEQLLAAILQAECASVIMLLYEAGIKEDGLRKECRESPKGFKREAIDLEKKFKGKNAEKYTVDLTDIARERGFDEVIGRKNEIDRVIAILARRKKNSACLIGEPGVGKTAIAEGIAQCIADGRVPDEMLGKRLVSLDISSMVAGTKYRGDFEERFKTTLSEISRAGNVIVFIDEMHTVMGAGAAEGAVDAANILKPVMSRAEIQLIGATTEEEYAQYVEKDKAFERRLLPVRVCEPDPEEARAIIMSQKPKLERHHRVAISKGAVESSIRLSKRYIHDRFLPDKALDLIDEAASKKRLGARPSKERIPCIGEDDIAEIVSMWTGIPVSRISEDESDSLLKLDTRLGRHIVGQDDAVKTVASALRRARTGLKDPKRPSGCFMFCGPSGVGKTEVCRTLARKLFGDEKALLRFDMSEYTELASASRLIGAPPGYVGHTDGGQLTDAVRKRPYSVVVFDEAEKANAQVLNLLLQIMEEGTLTDSQGRSADFSNCIVIMTSNIGAKHIVKDTAQLGFAGKSDSYENIKKLVDDELKNSFAPEFLNRIDETVVFRRLDEHDLCKVAGLLLGKLSDRLAEINIKFEWDESAQRALCARDDYALYGARPMRREITQKLENPIADMILRREVKRGDALYVSADGNELTINNSKSVMADLRS